MILLVGGLGDLPAQWQPLIRALGPDLPVRHARRGQPGELADEVAAVHRLVRQHGDEPVDLVAHSMGAFVAEAYARSHPGYAHGLVLLDPSVEGRPRRYAEPLAGRALRPTRRAARTRLAAALLGRGQRWLDPALPPEHVDAVVAALRDGDFIDRCLTEWNAYPRWAADLLDLRRHTPLPTARSLVVTAQRHRLSGWPRRHRALARQLGGHHRVVRPSGHLVMTAHPHRVAALIRAHLADRPAGG